jgi:Icc-related predicted phosphoesterase
MIVAAISDIHGSYRDLDPMPDADVMVIAGDFLAAGREFELRDFVEWLRTQPVNDIIVIAGNHDICLQRDDMWSMVAAEIVKRTSRDIKNPPKVHYLRDSSVTIHGLKFYGSPWTPTYGKWAFMKEDFELAAVWDQIPADTDVLITHGPPKDILDEVRRRKGYGLHVGSQSLRDRLGTRIFPKVHIFGHIHEHGGKNEECDGTKFYNVAALDELYQFTRPKKWTTFEVV